MTGYFFHCQHKYRTHGKKRTLNKSQRDESAHCAHDVDASIDVVIISVLCIWTGVYFHHRDYDSFFRVTVYFFLFFVNSRIYETAGWCCLFFMLIIPFSYIFFALVVYILSCEPSRAIFLYHSFFRVFFLQNMKIVFRYSIYIFFVLRSACSIPVLHLIHTVPCCVFYLCLCGSFPSFISLLLCFDAEISCAVFTDGVSWSRLRIILFFCLFVQQ